MVHRCFDYTVLDLGCLGRVGGGDPGLGRGEVGLVLSELAVYSKVLQTRHE